MVMKAQNNDLSWLYMIGNDLSCSDSARWSYILYFLAFLPSFRVSPPLLPQPMDLRSWFFVWQWVLVLACWYLEIWGQRSKVKIHKKKAFSWPILVTGAMCWAIQDQGVSGRVPLAVSQLILATCVLFLKSDWIMQWIRNRHRKVMCLSGANAQVPVDISQCLSGTVMGEKLSGLSVSGFTVRVS